MSKQKCYDKTFKLKAIETTHKKSKEAATREFKVDPKRIRQWHMQKEQLTAFTKTKWSTRKHLSIVKEGICTIKRWKMLFLLV